MARRAPGPELAGVLDNLDLSRLTGYDAVTALQAEYRQLAHQQARFLAALAEVGCCAEPDSLARGGPGRAR